MAANKGRDTRAAGSEDGGHVNVSAACGKCGGLSAGKKLLTCGGCSSVSYCSRACQEADWAEHRAMCKIFSESRVRSLAEVERCKRVPGSAQRHLKEDTASVKKWYCAVEGLADKVQFLAWKHRSESPLIMVSAESTSADTIPEVVMIPRIQWETDKSLNSDILKAARSYFAKSNFCADRVFVVYISVESNTSAARIMRLDMQAYVDYVPEIHSSVLATMTADDFAAEVVRRRNDATAEYVRLTGLCGAAHLNGKEAVLLGRDPKSSDRFTVRLGDGKEVNVRPQNFVAVTRSKLLNDEF